MPLGAPSRYSRRTSRVGALIPLRYLFSSSQGTRLSLAAGVVSNPLMYRLSLEVLSSFVAIPYPIPPRYVMHPLPGTWLAVLVFQSATGIGSFWRWAMYWMTSEGE